MFKVKIKEWGMVEVKFAHYNPNGGGSRAILAPGTSCVATSEKLKGIVMAGTSHLHPLDHSSYCKETGRKLTLHRALECSGLNKKERTKVWAAYFATKEKAREDALTREMYKQ